MNANLDRQRLIISIFSDFIITRDNMDNEHKQKTRLVRLPYFHCEMNDKPRWAVTDLLRSFFMFRIIYLYNHNPPKNASENSTRTIKWYFSNANCPIMTTLLTRCKFLFHQSVRTKK